MSGIRSRIKRIIPKKIWRPASDMYWWWFNRGQHVPSATFSPLRRKSIQRLEEYRDLHRGERCFIIGNGPSLRKMNLSLLREEYTFGLNRIYLIFPELGFTTTYLASVNNLVIEQCAKELKALEMPKFITWRARRWMSDDPRTIFIDSDYTQPETFAEDATGRIYEGCTVTYVALQLAFHMGFEKAILIGVDHHFTVQGAPNEMVVSEGEDLNHFHPDYFGKGFRWQLPDYAGSERAYRLAREAYERHGREVVDATEGGKLAIFQKADYYTLLDS